MNWFKSIAKFHDEPRLNNFPGFVSHTLQMMNIVEAANHTWRDLVVLIRSTTQQQQSGSVYFQQTASRRDQILRLWWPLVLSGKNEDNDGYYVWKICKTCHSPRISYCSTEMRDWILTWLTSPVESAPTSHGHWANDWGKRGCDSGMWSSYSYQLFVTCLSWRNVPKILSHLEINRLNM